MRINAKHVFSCKESVVEVQVMRIEVMKFEVKRVVRKFRKWREESATSVIVQSRMEESKDLVTRFSYVGNQKSLQRR